MSKIDTGKLENMNSNELNVENFFKQYPFQNLVIFRSKSFVCFYGI